MEMITFTEDEMIVNKNDFNYLIDIDDDFNSIVSSFENKYYINLARCMISSFNLNILNKFNVFLENIKGDSIDCKLGKNKLESFCNDLDENIIVRDMADLETLTVILKLAMMLVDSGLENNDMDCFYESFYQLENDLKNKSLIKNGNKGKLNFNNNNVKIIQLNLVQNSKKQVYSTSNNIF